MTVLEFLNPSKIKSLVIIKAGVKPEMWCVQDKKTKKHLTPIDRSDQVGAPNGQSRPNGPHLL